MTKFIVKLDVRNPNVLATYRGGGYLILLALPFFLAVLFLIGTSLGLWPEKGGVLPWYVAVPFSGVFTAAGAALMFGRSGVIINKLDKIVVTWWGVLVPFRQNEYSLDDFDRVNLSRELGRGKLSSYVVYPIRIASPARRINVKEPQDYHEARKIAVELATFLDTQLVDSTSGREVVRQADELHESLCVRAQRDGEATEMPKPPKPLRTRYTIEGRILTLDLPRKGYQASLFFSFMLALGLSVTFAWLGRSSIWPHENMPPPREIHLSCHSWSFSSVVPVFRPVRPRAVERRGDCACHCLA